MTYLFKSKAGSGNTAFVRRNWEAMAPVLGLPVDVAKHHIHTSTGRYLHNSIPAEGDHYAPGLHYFLVEQRSTVRSRPSRVFVYTIEGDLLNETLAKFRAEGHEFTKQGPDTEFRNLAHSRAGVHYSSNLLKEIDQ